MASTNNTSVDAAIITGIAALLGVIIGGVLQHIFYKCELNRKRDQAINLVGFFIIEVLNVLYEFNSKKNISNIHALSIKMPMFLQEQLDLLNSTISEYDAKIAVNILWLKQTCINIDTHLDRAKNIAQDNNDYKKIDENLNMALADVKYGIKVSYFILHHCFNNSKRKIRVELLKQNFGQKFFEEYCAKKNRFVNLLIKYGFKKI